MRRSTIALVAVAAFSTAALAQVGTDPIENKSPAGTTSAPPTPPVAGTSPGTATPSTDDAAPADRADVPANVTPAPGDPRDVTSPPPKVLH